MCSELLGDLVHILRMRWRSFGTVARGGRTSSSFLGETLALFLVALVIEVLGFIHGCPLAHGACHAFA